jgi:hypothetical protein
MVLLICIALTLGFLVAWITGIVAKEEVSIGRSTVIVVLTAIVFFVSFAVASDIGIVGAIIPLLATMLAMAGLLRALAYIPFKHGIVVSSIYSLIMLVCAFVMSSMGSD